MIDYTKRSTKVDYVKVGRVTPPADGPRARPTPDADGVIRLRKGESVRLSGAGVWR